MKAIKNNLTGLAILGGFIVLAGFIQAQVTTTSVQSDATSLTNANVDWSTASDLEVMLHAIEMTTPLPATAAPMGGNFYTIQHAGEWPPLPGDIYGLPFWDLGDGFYLLDDRGVTDYAALVQGQRQAMGMDDSGPPVPGDGSGSGGTNGYSGSDDPIIDYGTNLWIANFALSSGNAVGIVSNTEADISYEIQYVNDLTSTQWLSAGFILGSELTNWTTMVMTNALSYTNNLFLRIRSWASSDGSGLPDWWELQYFGLTGVDPYGDPAGDGWNNLYKFQHGMNPNVFYTPPAPQGVTAQVNPNNPSQVTLTWLPAQGAVTGYTIQTASYQYIAVGLTNQFVDTACPAYAPTGDGWNYPPYYMVQANYTQGGSAWSDAVTPYSLTGVPYAQALLASDGSIKFAVANIPAGASELKLTRMDWSSVYTLTGTTNFLVPASSFTNGLYTLPGSMTGFGPYRSDWYIQTVWSTNNESAATWAGSLAPLSGYLYDNPPGFFCDGRTQLVQNVVFLLRSANLTNPISYDVNGVSVYQPTNYTFASYYSVDYYNTIDEVGNNSWPDLNRPFDENYRYRNFLYISNTNLDSSGFLNTGCAMNSDGSYSLPSNPVFQFVAPTNSITIPALDQSTWMQPYPDYQSLGIYVNGSGQFVLPNNISNWFGLHLSKVLLAHNHGGTLYLDTLNAGGTWPQTNDTYYFYSQFDQPQLQTVGYYFGRSDNPYNNGVQIFGDPMPGDNDFSPTNAQPLMIAAVGQLFQAAAFAKQVVQNGDTSKPVYVAQYFDKAYEVDANGNVTTNQTGILSPYGTFFPTEPGPTALVTMPDINTGQRGTGIVQVVSLQLDANHDGNMDLSYFGQDYVPAYPPDTWGSFQTFPQPNKFWVNNGYDESGTGGNLDRDLPVPPNPMNYSLGKITCQRDLENFARLWVCGLPKLPTTSGYAITLSMSGNTAINLYAQYDTNGSAAYLTDTNAAVQQFMQYYLNGQLIFDFSKELTTINSSQSYTLSVGSDGTPDYTHFLFEGAGIGYGPLTLTISQNGNVIIQTSAYIELHDIKDLYEQAHIANVYDNAPGSSSYASTYVEDYSLPVNPAEDPKFVLFVHGWRMSAVDYQDFSDTMFKRLYWVGYQGRFASLRWPTLSSDDFWLPALDYTTYNHSEFRAWKSGAGLSAYLTHLKQRLPNYSLNVCAHSMGNVVVMEALRDQLAQGQTNVDNYVLMQAAAPAHCYQTNLPDYSVFTAAENFQHTPDTYRGYPGAINNAINGQMTDFFNTNDYALATGTLPIIGGVNWEANQVNFKPDGGYHYSTDGTNCWNLSTSITDPREIMAFCSRPRSKAVGALGGVAGAIHGNQVNLTANFGFGNLANQHSAQFNWNIQTIEPFYAQLLATLFPQHP